MYNLRANALRLGTFLKPIKLYQALKTKDCLNEAKSLHYMMLNLNIFPTDDPKEAIQVALTGVQGQQAEEFLAFQPLLK